MNMLTKLSLALLTTSTILSASGPEIHIGTSLTSMDLGTSESALQHTIGYGVMHTFESNIFLGVGLDFDYTNIYEYSALSYGADFKAGYQFVEKTNLYGLFSPKIQGFENGTGYGFGYGIGANYQPIDELAIALEYRTYNMEHIIEGATLSTSYTQSSYGINLIWYYKE
jgi:opacity protein-like surface antigen